MIHDLLPIGGCFAVIALFWWWLIRANPKRVESRRRLPASRYRVVTDGEAWEIQEWVWWWPTWQTVGYAHDYELALRELAAFREFAERSRRDS